ncbi:MAG: RdgB/HAM1 family non-canonical purine NTP pyrophosphatase [Candidatus Nanopelagicales bacterium]|jgi:XTP/dITP diphosphohydrolase|nr:RdgB/HAM1 family non-canonical purine NTP pyrophosphatase [Candidatus Nanopelagicales bacterium]
MKKIVLATANTHKVIEFQRILNELVSDLELVPASDFLGVPEVAETGATFAENALIKARAINDFTKLPALADDSGLVVDALNGAPGIFSARYAGLTATDAENVEKLLIEIKDISPDLLFARFECAIALVDSQQNLELVVEGQMPGQVIKEVRGANGFGYDPVFVPQGLAKTSAEISDQEKDQISHRGIALRKIAVLLKQLA